MTVDALITDINAAGFLVLNLFQHENRTWQANLYLGDDKSGCDWGTGTTPTDALERAFSAMKRKYGVKKAVTTADSVLDLI